MVNTVFVKGTVPTSGTVTALEWPRSQHASDLMTLLELPRYSMAEHYQGNNRPSGDFHTPSRQQGQTDMPNAEMYQTRL
ncbi:hypothetical protein ABBQ32_002955 [Trebouxia sp. C0010 RCD-2024]